MTTTDRPIVTERSTYAPSHKSETFIVPLLQIAISSAIKKYADGGKALDVGCGGQPFRSALEARGCHYVSLDANPTQGIQVDFVQSIDGQLPPGLVAAGPYDFILCTEVLEHVADWPAAFENLAGLLAPGGKLVLTAPHFYFLHEEPYDFYRPTLHAFKHFAGAHDLEVLESKPIGDAWDMLGTFLSCCRFTPADDSRISRLFAWGLWKLRDFCFRKIERGRIRRRVDFWGPTYLSNFVVLAAPGA